MFRGCIYVPDDKDLHRQIMSLYHDSRVVGHPGRAKTLELILRDYWWPQMARHVGLYTRTCETFLQNKVIRRRPIGKFNPMPTPEGQWETMSMDFIIELPDPDAHGFDAVMVVVDSVSKQAHFLATTTTVSAEGVARLYYRDVWQLHGLPLKWLHDRGRCSFRISCGNSTDSSGSKPLPRWPTTHRPNTSTRNSRHTSGCSAITIRMTGITSYLPPSSPSQTTSMLRRK